MVKLFTIVYMLVLSQCLSERERVYVGKYGMYVGGHLCKTHLQYNICYFCCISHAHVEMTQQKMDCTVLHKLAHGFSFIPFTI